MHNETKKKVAIIVAHPDDETLWAGGTILSHPDWECSIVSLCRQNDPDRAPKFAAVAKILGGNGRMGNLDDGPDQKPLPEKEVENAILKLLPFTNFDLVITHSIYGEYTRHRRHEEVGKAVVRLWQSGKINTGELWAFAYEDGNRKYYPISIEDAPVFFPLPHRLWQLKYSIITKTYGFNPNSWEANATPKEEAFWQFFTADDARNWLVGGNTTL